VSTELRQDIQQLRGLAILLVVAYHAGALLPSGFVGVDVFFVLSGFVITRSISRQVADGLFSLSNFLQRRIRRILPALACMLFVVITLSTWLSPMISRVQSVRTGLFAALGGANLFLYRFRPDGYFETSEKSNVLLHTWSLSLEEQFYLSFAVALVLAHRFSKTHSFKRILVCGAGCVLLASLAINLAASIGGIPISSSLARRAFGAESLDSQFTFYLPFARAWEFLVGVLASLYKGKGLTQPFNRYLVSSLGVGVLIVAGFIVPVEGFPGFWALLPVLATTVLLVGEVPRSGLPGGFGRLLSWFGDRSYSWYLWHWPLIQFVTPFNSSQVALIVAAFLSLIPASISFRYLEIPIRSNGYWMHPRHSASLAVGCVLLPLLAVVATRDPQPDLDHHIDVKLDCIYGVIQKLEEGGPCTLTTPRSAGVAALIGDSHASHLSEAFIEASRQLGLDAMLASRANTSFLLLQSVAVGGTKDTDAGVQQMMELLIRRKVRLVVIAQSDYSIEYISGQSWSDGMRPILTKLTRAGIKVVLVAQSTNIGADPLECSAFQVKLSSCYAIVERDSALMFGQRGRTTEEKMLTEEFNSVVYFDSAKFLCPEERCAIRRGGHWWWRDNGHISLYASQQLSEPLSSAMRRVLETDN